MTDTRNRHLAILAFALSALFAAPAVPARDVPTNGPDEDVPLYTNEDLPGPEAGTDSAYTTGDIERLEPIPMSEPRADGGGAGWDYVIAFIGEQRARQRDRRMDELREQLAREAAGREEGPRYALPWIGYPYAYGAGPTGTPDSDVNVASASVDATVWAGFGHGDRFGRLRFQDVDPFFVRPFAFPNVPPVHYGPVGRFWLDFAEFGPGRGFHDGRPDHDAFEERDFFFVRPFVFPNGPSARYGPIGLPTYGPLARGERPAPSGARDWIVPLHAREPAGP